MLRTRLIGGVVALVLALAGTTILVNHVRSLETSVAAEERPVEVLIAREQVPEGTPVEELGDTVTSEEIPARLAADGSVASLEQLAGQVTTVALEPGEQLIAARFSDPDDLTPVGETEVPEGLHQVTIALQPERAIGGRLAAGDTVGLFVSFDDGGEGEPTTHLVEHKLLVTTVQHGDPPPAPPEDGEAPEQSPAAPGSGLLVTLAAEAPVAERIVFAAEHGTVWLSSEPEDASEAGTGVQTKERIYD